MVKCLTCSYLRTSADGHIQLEIDRVLEYIHLELKIVSSYDSWEDCLQTATDIRTFKRCTFGSNMS